MPKNKTAILGPPKNGKTCLVQASISGLSVVFSPDMTHNFDQSDLTLHGLNKETPIKLFEGQQQEEELETRIWDFGGHTVYRNSIQDLIAINGAIVWVADSTALLQSLNEIIPMYKKTEETFKKFGLPISTSTIYFSKILDPSSQLYCLEGKKVNTQNLLRNPLLNEVYEIIKEKMPSNHAICLGDTFGVQGVSNAVMYCSHGPYGRLSNLLKTPLRTPIVLANIHALQSKYVRLINNVDNMTKKYLKINNLALGPEHGIPIQC